MNVVMNDAGKFIEVQGTAEEEAFDQEEFNAMLDLAKKGLKDIFILQENALASK